MHVVLLGHGSRDPRHADTIRSIATALNQRSHRATVGAAFLDLCPPTLAEAVTDLGAFVDQGGERTYADDDTIIVVPMLLTAAFHASVDVPAAVAAAQEARPGVRFLVADVLGPAPDLVAAMERRLREAGVDRDDPATGVLLVAAGSSDDGARAAVALVARDWLGDDGRGAHAFCAGAGPTVDEAVRSLVARGATRVAVAPYLLAAGVLPDRAFDAARSTGAELGVEVVVAAPLGDAPELLDLVPERARGAAS